jgi:hypothetical protein
MAMRRAGTPGLRATAAEPGAPAASVQLVDELYRGHALRLTRMALLLLGCPAVSGRCWSCATSSA